jgi:4-hydroxybenzoate polyprenyltransferase
MPWLQLIRWQNLLIILLTQFLAWWCVVLPGSPGILNPRNFCLLAISTMLIAAAGYIINDYFDIKIDTINKPGKVVLEKIIPRKQAIIAHALLNIIALLLAGYIAAQAHHYEWLLLQAACSLLLWFYSTDFKQQYMIGNLVVAALTALTILSLIIYEPSMPQFSRVVLLVYAYFAFMLTWMREIVKDMEDHIGDEAEGCITMPIKKGLDYSARFSILLSILVILPLGWASVMLFDHDYKWLSLYIVAILIMPLILWSVFLLRKTTTQHYHNASTALKIIMLLGICSLLIYHFQLFTNRAS